MKITIRQGNVGLLYLNGAFEKILEAGRHEFKDSYMDRLFGNVPDHQIRFADLRQRSLTIKGQEILTADKVAVRVSLLVYFRVIDPIAALHEVEDYNDRIYEDVQLAARRYLASRKLDSILNDRNEISDSVRDEVAGPAAGYGVEILRADVKDLVFPGNLRQIMNQVLETERRAEARLVEANKSAEADLIRAQTENTKLTQKLEAEQKQSQILAATEREKLRIELEAEVAAAKATAENPAILELRRLEVLRELAGSGNGKFVIGLDAENTAKVVEESATRD